MRPADTAVRTIIIGAGAAGLGAAYQLRLQQDDDFLLLEAGERPGGVIGSERSAGFLFEAGPDSWLGAKHSLTELCRELGLGDELVPSDDHARQTLIACGRRLLPLPAGWQLLAPGRLDTVAASRLLDWRTKLRIVAEFFAGGDDELPEDESVADFLRRLYGPAVIERIAAPLLAGVYGGEPEELSLAAIAPRLLELKRNGSLTRALWRARRRAATPGPLFTSLRHGMQSLVQILAQRTGWERLRLGTRAAELRRTGKQWRVTIAGTGELSCERLILALPAWTAAELLRETDAELAAELAAIPYTSALILNFGYRDAPALPAGFGVLIARSEGRRMLACSFSHRKFPGRAPAGGALLRLFYGGRRDASALDLADDTIAELGLRELRALLGDVPAPDLLRIARQPRTMAQYAPGHAARRERIERLRRRWPGLELAGNAYQGIGVPDSLESGRAAAREGARMAEPRPAAVFEAP